MTGALLVAFGGAMLKIQPPGEGIQEQIGFIASFETLLVLLIIWAIIKNIDFKYIRIGWLCLGALFAVLSVFSFQNNQEQKNEYVIGLPPDQSTHYHIVGDRYTPYGDGIKSQAPSKAELVDRSGGVPAIPKIWNDESIKRVSLNLTTSYFWVVIFLTSAVFSLTEGSLASRC